MLDIDEFVKQCLADLEERDPRAAVRETLTRTLSRPKEVSEALEQTAAGLNILYQSPELTVVNVIWAPKMSLYPHDHRMWAVIGIYGGVEVNTFYKRTGRRVEASRGRELREAEVLPLGAHVIHAVANPERRFTGAIHVYGGDFLNQPRSQWNPETFEEEPYDIEEARRQFELANETWAHGEYDGFDRRVTSDE